MLKTYKTYNLKMKILKYEFNNKLLSDIILFKVILVVTWAQPFFFNIKNINNDDILCYLQTVTKSCSKPLTLDPVS